MKKNSVRLNPSPLFYSSCSDRNRDSSSILTSPSPFLSAFPSSLFSLPEMPLPLGSSIPTLHLAPLLDPTSTPVAIARGKKFVAGLEVVELPGVGHWVLLEDHPNGWKRVEKEAGEWIGRVLEKEKREGREKGRL